MGKEAGNIQNYSFNITVVKQDLFIVSTGGILDKAAAVLVRLVHAVHGVVTAALRGHTLPALRGTK